MHLVLVFDNIAAVGPQGDHRGGDVMFHKALGVDREMFLQGSGEAVVHAVEFVVGVFIADIVGFGGTEG